MWREGDKLLICTWIWTTKTKVCKAINTIDLQSLLKGPDQ